MTVSSIESLVTTYRVGHPERFRNRITKAQRTYERARSKEEKTPRLAGQLSQIETLRDSVQLVLDHWSKLSDGARGLLVSSVLLQKHGDSFDHSGRKLTAEVAKQCNQTMESLRDFAAMLRDFYDAYEYKDRGGQPKQDAEIQFLVTMAWVYDEEIRDEPTTTRPDKHKKGLKTKFVTECQGLIGLTVPKTRSRLAEEAIRLQTAPEEPISGYVKGVSGQE